MTTMKNIEKELWDAADSLRANSELSSNEYSAPVLGLIFLLYADYKFQAVLDKLDKNESEKIDIVAAGAIYLPESARYKNLLDLPEGSDMGNVINNVMKSIEQENEDFKGILPKNYTTIDNQTLTSLLKSFSSIDFSVGDVFGKIYEYFLGKFALAEGQGGGEFFTPSSIVKLIVEIIEPYEGRIYDPACGSGGMFVQSANFTAAHQKSVNESLSVYGQEKTGATVKLGKMNLAIHGISGDIRQGNTYYDDIHQSLEKFDYVMANPPFNVNGIDRERIKNDPRFPFGIPNNDNGNYLWIQIFYSTLNANGRAGFVMANSASDARNSELEIRKKLIEKEVVDVMVAIGPNMFYNVTLPCQLWFFDKRKDGTDRAKQVLFIDARHIFHQIDRAHRDFTESQIEFISNIVNLYREENPEFVHGSETLFKEHNISTEKYEDCLGLCKVATINEIEKQDWTLNPGRYVGIKENVDDEIDFEVEFTRLTNELKLLNTEAHELEEMIEKNAKEILKKC